MSIHFMIIMLSFVAPVHKDLELVDAPQVVAPLSIADDRPIARSFWDE